MFVTNSGTAIPIGNTLDILGTSVAAGTNPVFTTGATNVVTIEVQTSQAIAASDATKVGLAAFNSTDFTVDANGFVTFSGAGATETLTGNSGGAVSPTANNINTVGTGSITIAGNPGTSTLTTQLTGLTNHSLLVGAGTATITNLGVATNGQLPIGSTGADPVLATLSSTGGTISITNGAGSISLDVNGSKVGETITGNSGGALSPTAGNWNILGASTAAGTTPVTTAGAGSTLTVDVQKSQAIAATDATKIGLSAFDSADFTVDANGFVSASSTGFLKTLTGNSGGAISPTANNINTLGTGSITIAGAGSTLTTQLTGLTNHAIQIGAGTATLTQLGAGTTGQVLQTNTGADPTWSTATYPSTTTINQILYSSANNIVAGLATANQGVLTTGATGTPVITALATNGQLIIGSTAGVPAAATLSAGTGITITNGSNSITIAASGTSTLNYTSVNHAASPYTVVAADDFLGVNSTAGVVSILLPNAPSSGRVYEIKDSNGQAVTNNITVTTVGGAVTIDGATSYVMKTNYQSIQVIFNGTSYEVF